MSISERQFFEKMTSGTLSKNDRKTLPEKHTFSIETEQKEWLNNLTRSQVSDFNEKLRALIDYWRYKTEN